MKPFLELNMKTIAMIPARLESKRVPKKNLRLINGRPLISYAIESAVKSDIFDEVYLNSESELFSKIADEYGALFYKRPEKFSTDLSNNDDFVTDFMKNVDGDILIQILPTSPLLSTEEIQDFVREMVNQNLDTQISIVAHKIASIYKDQPVNFKILEPHISSQNMIPVETYATVLMGWKYKNFLKNIEELGLAYHGGNGKIGYHQIKGLSTIDIDHEEDFRMAEVAMKMQTFSEFSEPEYYKPKLDRIEVGVEDILERDGVLKSNYCEENLPLGNLSEIIERNDPNYSWCHRLVNTENNSATLVAQIPGEGNRLHYHPDWNEWWYIVQGQWKWNVEGEEFIVQKGDFVFIKKGLKHKILAIGDEIAIRLAVSRADVEHAYPNEDS